MGQGAGGQGEAGEGVIHQALRKGPAIIRLHQVVSVLECDVRVSIPLIFQRKPDIPILKEYI